MKRQRAKLANNSVRSFHYNTRSSSSRHECREISNTDSDAIAKSTSRVTKGKKKISDDRSKNSVLLPIDLIMEILKRLPVKTLSRFLCVSKLWASIIRRRDFMKLFLIESWNRPGRLFFTFKHEKECFLLSLLQNPGEASSIANYHMTHIADEYTSNSSSLHGLVCYGIDCASALVVYNPSTTRSITLPKFDPGSLIIKHLLSYNPIDGVYKVLCFTGPRLVSQMAEPKLVLQVLTLGGNENEWRVIGDSHTRFHINSQICIDGVLYYDVYADKHQKEIAVMSFDVRSEKFDLIKGPGGDAGLFSSMIRYEGKVAILSIESSANHSMVSWVLEDAVKQIWLKKVFVHSMVLVVLEDAVKQVRLKKVFVLPGSLASLAGSTLTSSESHEFHRFINVTDAGELILSPPCLWGSPYYVLYYDPKRNSMRKVVVEVMTEHKIEEFCVLFDHFSSQAESLMFL